MSRRELRCWRVPMMVGTRSLAPVITAASPVEVREKARFLGHELIQRRLPWLMEAGRTKPRPDPRALEVTVGEPVLLHAARNH